jgi:hypothetical protein
MGKPVGRKQPGRRRLSLEYSIELDRREVVCCGTHSSRIRTCESFLEHGNETYVS